jgi:hypothetical protein
VKGRTTCEARARQITGRNANAAGKGVSVLTRSQTSESQSAAWMDRISPTGP